MSAMSCPSTPRRRNLSALFLAVALLAGACSSSDGGLDLSALDASDSGTETTTAEAASTDDAAVETEASDDTADEAAEEAAADPAPDAEAAPASTTAAPTTVPEELPPLPEFCNRDLVAAVIPVELTFTTQSGLFSVDFDGAFECLLVIGAGVGIDDWNAQGDKVALSDGTILAVSGEGKQSDLEVRSSLEFSRPTGFNVYWLADGVLTRSRIDGLQVERYESLGVVSSVAHHPDGQHLLLAADGGGRIVVADFEGQFVGNLLDAGPARITEIATSVDGSQLLFIAQGGDGVWRVHHLDLPSVTTSAVVEEEETDLAIALQTIDATVVLYESGRPMSGLVVNADATRAAIAEGDCAGGSSVEWLDLVAQGYGTPVLPNSSSRPVGFTAEGTLAVIEHRAACDGGGALSLVDLDDGEVVAVYPDVDDALVRTIDPPARYSLRDVAIG